MPTLSTLKRFPALCLVLILSACHGYSLVEDKPVTIGKMTVSPHMRWNKAPEEMRDVTRWTAHGLGLDTVYFYSSIADGTPLWDVSSSRKKDTRPYRQTMLPDEVMELVSYSWSQQGAGQVKAGGLKPAPFGKEQGFRFNMDYVTPDGLRMKSIALAAQPGGKLQMILFTAPQEHYFDDQSPIIEKVFATAQLTD